jgi:hypothetical protein
MATLRIDFVRLTAKLRKHWLALVALAAFHFVFFFPTLFMGRLLSPNDVFYNYEPWATYRPPSIVRVQNALLNDPATAYLPVISLMKRGWSAFHWNPYIGAGIPGFGSSSSPVLSPFIFLPALVVPLSWLYTGIILAKVNVAFWFAYAWLREERLGKRGAAIGALVVAAAGIYSVRYLWQVTNATPLYPALLWIVRRMYNGKRVPIWLMSLIALGYALSGFPATMAYGAWIAVAYAVFLAIRERRIPLVHLSRAAVAVVIGGLIASPSLVPFVQFLRRSGYLGMRENAAALHYPLAHWRSFFDPQRLGNPALKNWLGDQSLGLANNYVEATIYLGFLVVPLALLALFRRGQRDRWFWIVSAGLVVLCMFGLTFLPGLLAHVPGFKYSPMTRLALLLPIPAGFLTAAGAAFLFSRFKGRARSFGVALAGIVALIVAVDLGVFAGAFHPFLEPRHTDLPRTPVIEFLQNDPQPYRVIGFLGYLWPNSAELYEIQDVASHFYSEAEYRKLVSRFDAGSWSGFSTVIQFSSLTFKFTDPLVSMLGVRYFLEHRAIDIVKWTIFRATVPAVTETGAFKLSPGTVAQRSIPIDAEPFWAIELPVSVDEITGASPRLDAELSKNGRVVWARAFAAADVNALSKVYIPVRPYATIGETVTLRIWATGMRARLLKSDERADESPIYYGRVTIPIVFDREFPDGRVFRNLAEVPRFNAVKAVRKMNEAEMLATPEIDFAQEAVITDDPVFPPNGLSADGHVELVHYAPAEQRMVTTSTGRLFLASAEKLTPELRITIDGKPARPIQINGLFAGVVVPAGEHHVTFSRRIGRGWWVVSASAALMLLLMAIAETTWALRRR